MSNSFAAACNLSQRARHGASAGSFIRLASRRTCLIKYLQITLASQTGVEVEVIVEVE
jgi:hypothetical protein